MNKNAESAAQGIKHERAEIVAEAFQRNLGLITPEESKLLARACVAIPGLGGVGGAHAEVLARQGIGRFKLADFDTFSLANFNRQFGATYKTLGMNKAEVIGRRIRDINQAASIRIYDGGINLNNVGSFLDKVNVVVDSLDYFCIEERRMLFREAYRRGIPVVTAGPLGFGAILQVVMPGGMTFDDFYDIRDDMSFNDKILRFTVGVAPKGFHLSYMDLSYVNFRERRGPSSSIGVTMCAAAAGMEVLKILLGWEPVQALPHYFQYDLRKGIRHHGCLRGGNRHPLQRLKIAVMRRRLKDQIDDGQSNQETRRPVNFHVHSELTEKLKVILEAARRSPTPDNCKPWLFNWDGEKLSISLDEDRARHQMDRAHHASYLSLGCLLESIHIAARDQQLAVAVEYSHEVSEFPVVSARFSSLLSAAGEPLTQALFHRHTDRLPYRGGSIDAEAFQLAAQDARNFPSNRLHFIPKPTGPLRRLIEEAETFIWQHKKAQQDLMRWFRLNPFSKAKSQDGMDREALGVNAFQAIMLMVARWYPVQVLLNKAGFLWEIKRHTRALIESSAGLGVIAVKDTDPKSLIAAGQLMLRVWCRLNSAGYGFHPYTASALGAYDAFTGQNGDSMSPRFQKLFRDALPIYREAFHLSDSEIPVMLFRTGIKSN